jgi:hypothetical protein
VLFFFLCQVRSGVKRRRPKEEREDMLIADPTLFVVFSEHLPIRTERNEMVEAELSLNDQLPGFDSL